MICVYESNCTDFSNNGLGLVTPQSCTVTETLNGEWELTLVHPIDDYGKWQRLTEGRILRAPVPAAMTPQVNLITQQYQTATYDILVYKVSTNKDPLRLRSGTGTKYKILGKYKKGTEVIVLNKTTSSWYEVTCPDGKHGYMSAQYLTYVRTDTGATQTNVGFTNEVVESCQLRDQPFRIYRVVPDLGKITVYARHIFYDLIDNMIQSVKPASDAVGASVVKNLSDGCLTEHDFTFYSDLKTTADAAFENINPVEAMLGEGGITDAYHAELARDWFDVFLVSRVGADTDVQIREKKNLTGISYDVDETDAVTRIMPTGEDADGNLLYLPELYIDSPNIGAYHQPKWVHLAVAEAKEVTEGDETRSKSECYAIMRKAVQAEYDAGCDLPTVTLSVDFVNCADTEEHREYAALSNIFLGDSVRVIARRIGVEVTMRMTQYTYDCLTRKYTAVTLGTAAATLENTTVAARQLASGSISGAKLMLGSIGSGHLQSGSVGSLQVKAAAIGAAHIQNAAISSAHIQDAAIQSAQIADAAITSAKIGDAAIGSAHIQDAVIESGHIAEAAIGSAHIQNASITSAHIAAALVDVLNVNALNAVTARIGELAAGQITTDELYASIAMIAVAQLTTANIISADIQWADIESLAADIASISRAQINTANIENANIDWAAITTLTAAVGAITKANIETADIDWSHIKDLATDTAIITQGTAGQLYISRLAVTEANMASLTVGELVVKGSDGHFYSVSVDKNGEVVTALKQVVNDDVADLSIHGTEKLIEGSITARTLNVQEIFGDNATIRSLIAANIDVDTLFAREATITALNAMDITSNTYLRLMVDKKADQTDVDAIEDRLSAAELKITEGAIVSTVTRSETYTSDLAAVQSAADNAQSSANAAKTAASNAQSAADAAQRSIDGLSVGGRNLILRSATQGKDYGNAREGAELVEGETCLGCNVFRTSMAWMDISVNLTRLINTHGLKAGDVVTYSIYNKSDDMVARKYSCFYSPPSTTDSGSKALLTLDDRLHTEWTRLVCTFTITEDIMGVAKAGTTMPLRFECHTANTEGTYQYWAAPKLELGNVATDWTPAPEDLTDGIDAAQSAADGAQSAADANAATISALATRVTTAEQKITADAIVSTVT